MNAKLKKEAKYFEKYFFKLTNNAVFGKTMESVRRQRDIKLVTTDKKEKCLLSELQYHTRKWRSKNLFAIKMKKHNIKNE